jgi:type IV pilus assembly protein PilB
MRIDNIEEKTLKELLVEHGYVEEQEMQKSEEAARLRRVPIVDYLISENIVTKDLVGQAIAEALKMPYADLNSRPPTRNQVLQIPEETAKEYRAVLFSEDSNSITIASDDPTQSGLLTVLAQYFPVHKLKLAYSLPEDIDANFIYYQKPLETRFSKIITGHGDRVAPELLEEIFADAKLFRASDIHFEPQKEEVVVRFRVDGVLHEAGRLPKEQYENILNRIKVQSRLRIDEHYAAQDGSMRHEQDDTVFEMRTSIIPTVEGEKVALRVLSSYVAGLTMADLGLAAPDEEKLKESASRPFGMILVVGPTGAGKTTTLYAVLKLLNRPEVNITTIEDPVEYKIVGINQIQVNAQTNLTFAEGLRSIVRQDPNIILVGEIRDTETAEIGVNAALTGHLLLSTFHANDAATTIPRLLDMKVEPFLLASTLEIIVAQRLVRKICESCRESNAFSDKVIKQKYPDAAAYLSGKQVTLYAGRGCGACGHTGFTGRTAIFELINITPAMEELMLKHPSTREVAELARKEGSKTFFEDGIEKVKAGVTTIEELLRVAQPPD